MGYTRITPQHIPEQTEGKRKQKLPLHIALFVASFISMLMAGTQWAGKDFLDISNWQYGFTYAILLITFLSAHEFGHYFAARFHKVDATLPYFIPFPLLLFNPFGSMGAVIRTRTPIYTRKALFDIGVAGPLAGFVVCLIILVIGLLTLPDKSYIYQVHPEYLLLGGTIPKWGMYFGDTLLYSFLASVFGNSGGFLPPMNEIYHYPFLCVGWFGMFVTALNLLPIGQLDGGHITYAMFGRWHRYIARAAWWLIFIAGTGWWLNVFHDIIQTDQPDDIYTFFQSLLLPTLTTLKTLFPWWFASWGAWVFWALLVRFIVRLDHPPVPDTTPIGTTRMVIGWGAIAIFVLTISYNGLYEIAPSETQKQQLQKSKNDFVEHSSQWQHNTATVLFLAQEGRDNTSVAGNVGVFAPRSIYRGAVHPPLIASATQKP